MLWTKKCRMCKAKVYPPYIYPNRAAFKRVPLCQYCFDKMEKDCDEIVGNLSEILSELKGEKE